MLDYTMDEILELSKVASYLRPFEYPGPTQ